MTLSHSLILLLLAYLLGSLPIGLLVGRMVKNIDVRDFGSGNIGASNVWRTMGPLWGTAVFLFDFGKGYLPTVMTVQMADRQPGLSPWLPVAVGLAAILGHNFSPFLRFKGGKGVATSLGVVFGIAPLAALGGFAVWGICLAVTRYISLSSIIAALATSVILVVVFHDLPHTLFALLVAGFVVFKHRPNIARLQAGTEPKIKTRLKSSTEVNS